MRMGIKQHKITVTFVVGYGGVDMRNNRSPIRGSNPMVNPN